MIFVDKKEEKLCTKCYVNKYYDILSQLHNTIAVLDIDSNQYEIILDKNKYFENIPQKGNVSDFISKENSKIYKKESSLVAPCLNEQYLTNKMNDNDKDLIELCFNVENSGNKLDKVMVKIVTIDKYYFYLVEVEDKFDCFDVGDDQKLVQIREKEEFSRVALSLSTTALFKFNIKEEKMIFYSNRNLLLQDEYVSISIDEFINSKVIDEDTEMFNNLIYDMKNGISNFYEIRIIDRITKQKKWYRIKYDFIYDNGGKLISAVGQIIDIDSEVKYKLKAEKDLLTGCYNKETTENMATDIINKSGGYSNHYLILIDVDNFKAVNDNLGHSYGDMVLKELASKLKQIFQRESDIVGRIGGDEFAIFVKDFNNGKVLIDKLEEVRNAFQNTYTDGNMEYKVSSSIGVAKFPEHGKTFKELYIKSDSAMYEVKKRGKNQYCIFNDNIEQSEELHTTHIDTMQRSGSSFMDIQNCFEIFEALYDIQNSDKGYGYKELEEGIDKALSMIGNIFNLDRCYIFETNEDSTLYSSTHTWSNKGINPMDREATQNMGVELWEPITSLYDETGIFYFSDVKLVNGPAQEILETQNVLSMLQCSFKRNDKIKIIIGFDNCSNDKKWSVKLINTLVLMSKILAIYVLGKQNKK